MNPAEYWNKRYREGGHSGNGSRGRLARFKAEVLNGLVAKREIGSVIEFGCGDGQQLLLAKYPRYTGFDISEEAVSKCYGLFGKDDTKRFGLLGDYCGETAELALSLDVIYHLTSDEMFADHLHTLFSAALRYVCIYSTNYEQLNRVHPCIQHHRFTDWIGRNIHGWRLLEHIPNRYPYQGDERNESDADFYIYAN